MVRVLPQIREYFHQNRGHIVSSCSSISCTPIRKLKSYLSFFVDRGCPLGVSRVIDSVYVCGAHSLPGAVKALHPGLVVNAAPELPPPPEDYVPRHYVPLLDTPNSDMHPHMERVADLINEVGAPNDRDIRN